VKVFSNTTPFIALASIQRLDLLPQLFGQIHVTEEVIGECAIGGPVAVPPLRELGWIVLARTPTQPAPHILLELDKGEKTTLQAALAENADLVLMDEKIGRNMAEYLGLRVAGTLGILLKAHKAGLIASFRDSAQLMRAQGIFFHETLIDRLAVTVGE
jgi:predicted nucleic acid-binding protein